MVILSLLFLPDLNDSGLWWGANAVTYYIGPGAGDVTFKKSAGSAATGENVLKDKLTKKL